MKRLANLSLFGLCLTTASVQADIFQWEYINPADPSQGKQQSTMLAPDGAGAAAVPGADLSGRNLTMAYLIGTDLTGATGYYANLTNADLSQANLSGASLWAATLTDANFTGAFLRGASVGINEYDGIGTGITLAQLYSTASYLAGDLSGISLEGNDLRGGNFAGQNLADAGFYSATLTDANFTDAEVRGASFYKGGSCTIECEPIGTGITLPQLYSTGSYQAHDLTGIDLGFNDLRGANFAGQNLSNADFYAATLTDADFTGADISGANFGLAYNSTGRPSGPRGTGITPTQVYSSANYRAGDLSGINFERNNLSSGNFSGQNLSNADFLAANLTGANLREANLTNASFFYYGCDFQGVCFTGSYATLIDADLAAADSRGAHISVFDPAIATTNLIGPGGHINGLDLDAGGLLVVRDYDGDPTRTNRLTGTPTPIPPIQITVGQHLAMGPGGTLRMVFEADAWDSTISFAPGIPATLGGMLELTFADDVNLATQLGRTFDLFDWTGVTPTGFFSIVSPYTWDDSNLYLTGEVTLTAVPEPASYALAMACAFGLTFFHPRRIP